MFDSLTEMERLTLEVLESKVYQLAIQAQSSRCEAKVIRQARDAKRCLKADGHDGEHYHADRQFDPQAISWTS